MSPAELIAGLRALASDIRDDVRPRVAQARVVDLAIGFIETHTIGGQSIDTVIERVLPRRFVHAMDYGDTPPLPPRVRGGAA